jgi:DNA-directed RNA polymerase specialized sigma24 family protein
MGSVKTLVSHESLNLLLDRIRHQPQDGEAWDALVTWQRPVLASVARRELGRHDLVEDAVQAALVRLLSSVAGYRPGSEAQAQAWLIELVRCASRDLRRREAVRRRPAGAVAVVVEEGGGGIDEMLALLPPHQRQVVQLQVGDGCRPHEVARKLGWSVGRVRREARSALGRLRRQLAAWGALVWPLGRERRFLLVPGVGLTVVGGWCLLPTGSAVSSAWMPGSALPAMVWDAAEVARLRWPGHQERPVRADDAGCTLLVQRKGWSMVAIDRPAVAVRPDTFQDAALAVGVVYLAPSPRPERFAPRLTTVGHAAQVDDPRLVAAPTGTVRELRAWMQDGAITWEVELSDGAVWWRREELVPVGGQPPHLVLAWCGRPGGSAHLHGFLMGRPVPRRDDF